MTHETQTPATPQQVAIAFTEIVHSADAINRLSDMLVCGQQDIHDAFAIQHAIGALAQRVAIIANEVIKRDDESMAYRPPDRWVLPATWRETEKGSGPANEQPPRMPVLRPVS
jgi:hypothetical protein